MLDPRRLLLLAPLLALALPALADDTSDFNAAIADTRTAGYHEIVRNLVAINKDNPYLTWNGTPGASGVLMCTWTGNYYNNYVGKGYDLPVGVNVWVTAVPEVRDWFSSRNTYPADPTVAARKLLGLYPTDSQDYFVELWVLPKDLVRPSADPEIIDSESSLEFPWNNTSSAFTTFNSTRIIKDSGVRYTYQAWFLNRRATLYDAAKPYPWTRLGYTYNWANLANPVGASEFLLVGNSTVTVKSVTATNDYFTRPSSTGQTGCVLNPEAGFGPEFLLAGLGLAAGVALRVLRSRRS